MPIPDIPIPGEGKYGFFAVDCNGNKHDVGVSTRYLNDLLVGTAHARSICNMPIYAYLQVEHIWLCSCGTHNIKEDYFCFNCGENIHQDPR